MKNIAVLSLLFSSSFCIAQKQVTVEDIYQKGTFRQESLSSLNWMNNGQYYSALEGNQIVRYNVTTGESDSVIVDGKSLNIKIDDYEISADEKRVLLLSQKEFIYRRSFTAEYYVLTFKGSELKKLSPNGRQSYATFSPDNSMIAFTRDNNLFYTKLVNMSEYQVTNDGKFGEIINGSADWVYEEELYITKAFDWSVDSKKLAYYRFDESNVEEYNMQVWANESLYPFDYRYKYPKAGEKNAVVDIKIYNLENNTTLNVDFGEDKDFYISKMQWTQDPNMLSVMKLNRLQNQLDIYHVNAKLGGLIPIYTDKSKTYLDVTYAHDLIYLNNGTQFLYSTEREGHKHYYLHKIDGQMIYRVTSGNWDAEQMIALDQKPKTPVLYYISNEGSSLEKNFYKVDVKGNGKIRLSKKGGTNSVDMSKDFKYYISFNHSATQPLEVSLMSNRKNELVKVLKDNAKLKEIDSTYNLAKKIFFELDAADKKLLNSYMLQPAKFDSTKIYPVLIFQYSGPGSQNVTNSWAGRNFYWHQLLTQKGYVVVVVDTRGTGGKGEAFKKMTYMQLGKLEAEDLIATAKQLGDLDFIDKNRIGIWGWSYGGYMSSLSMMKGDGIFKAGIAVAPVTTWRYYDTIYTERYLRKPQDNPEGYDNNSPNSYAERLKGNFLLIHGTGDDNVHFQNSVALQNRLIESNKQFQSFYYPDRNHSIYGGNTRIHLFTMMTDFIVNNL